MPEAQIDSTGGYPVTQLSTNRAAHVSVVSSTSDGTTSDVRATWYDSVASMISLMKLSIAILVGAGSHAYGYDGSNQLITDAWTLFGTTRTKTFTYTSSNLTAETDWV